MGAGRGGSLGEPSWAGRPVVYMRLAPPLPMGGGAFLLAVGKIIKTVNILDGAMHGLFSRGTRNVYQSSKHWAGRQTKGSRTANPLRGKGLRQAYKPTTRPHQGGVPPRRRNGSQSYPLPDFFTLSAPRRIFLLQSSPLPPHDGRDWPCFLSRLRVPGDTPL